MFSKEKNFLKIFSLIPWYKTFLKTFPRANIYLVGGAVRDIIQGKKINDIDLVVQHVSEINLIAWLKKQGRVKFVGKHFGVYNFIPKKKQIKIDIALPRKERAKKKSLGKYKDFIFEVKKNLPIETDLARRDFTINAMAYDLQKKILLDPFDGLFDLSKGYIKTVGNPQKRLKEDLSRILRAIRFACQLNFSLSSKTKKAIQHLAPQLQKKSKGIFLVPRETIGKEFIKSFSANPLLCLELYQKTGIFPVIFPKLFLSVKTKKILSLLIQKQAPLHLLLVAFFLCTQEKNALSSAKTLIKKYRLSLFPQKNPLHIYPESIFLLIEQINFFKKNEPKYFSWSLFESMFLSKQGKDLLFLLEMILKIEKIKKQKELKIKIHQTQKRIKKIALLTKTPIGTSPLSLVNGKDILSLFPNLPGPKIGFLLTKARELQLDGKLQRKKEALAWIKQQLY